MWRSRKFIVAVLAAALLLVGIIGGVALAADDGGSAAVVDSATDDSGDSQPTTLLGRVAEILGIDQQTVEDAFAQAQSEMREEAMDTYLQKLVDEGKITQEQADQYKTWWQSKPDMTPYQQWLEAQPDLGVRGFLGGIREGMMRGGCGCLR